MSVCTVDPGREPLIEGFGGGTRPPGSRAVFAAVPGRRPEARRALANGGFAA
ncbi:hypothetical protein [Nocardia sp. NPDC003963]